jgi:hypothetical protein
MRTTTRKKTNLKRKESAELFDEITEAFDVGKTTTKKKEKPSKHLGEDKKVRTTGYILESTYEKLLDAISAERKIQRQKGITSFQGKLDLSAVMNEALVEWMKKRKH